MRTQRDSLCVVGGLAVCALLWGCHRPAPRVSSLPPSSYPRPLAVRYSPAYQEAEKLYARHDYREALAGIDRLLAAPKCTGEERSFLEKQRDICQVALDPHHPPSRSPAAPARKPIDATCGPRALAVACARLGIHVSVQELQRLAGTTSRGTTMAGLARAAQAKGLKAEGVQMDEEALRRLKQPAVAWVDGKHYVAVLRMSWGRATIQDPNKTREEVIQAAELYRQSQGILLVLSHK